MVEFSVLVAEGLIVCSSLSVIVYGEGRHTRVKLLGVFTERARSAQMHYLTVILNRVSFSFYLNLASVGRIISIYLLVPDAENVLELSCGQTAKMTQSRLVHVSGYVSRVKAAALSDVTLKSVLYILVDEIKHRRYDQLVPGEIRMRADHVTADSSLPEAPIIGHHRFVVFLILLLEPRVVLKRPSGFPIVNNSDLGSGFATRHTVNKRKAPCGLLHGVEDSRVLVTHVIHHRAVPFLGVALTFSELEILHGITAVSYRRQGLCGINAGALELIIRLPVYKTRCGLHKQEGLFLYGAENVVPEGMGDLHPIAVIVVPIGIAVPGDKIDGLAQLVIVESTVIIHHIRRHGQGRILAHRGDLRLHKVGGLMSYEAMPIQRQAIYTRLAVAVRRLYILEAVVFMTPYRRVVSAVQLIEASAAQLAHVLLKRLYAQRAIALAAVLVGQMPGDDRRMIAVALCQLLVHDAHLLSHYRGGVAVVVSV